MTDLDGSLDDAAAVLVPRKLQHGGLQQGVADGHALRHVSALHQALRHVVAKAVLDDIHRLRVLHEALRKKLDLRMQPRDASALCTTGCVKAPARCFLLYAYYEHILQPQERGL